MGTTCSSPTERSSASLRRLKGEQSGCARKPQRSPSVTSSSGVDVKVTPTLTTARKETTISIPRSEENCLAPKSSDAIILPDMDSLLMTTGSPDVRSLVPSVTTMTPECASTCTTPRLVKRAVSSLNDIPEHVYRLLKGQPYSIDDVKPKVIRLFVVACSSDSTSEREVLEHKIFPTLKEFCAEKHYCLELVDNNWPTCCHVTEIRRQLSEQLLKHCILTSSLVLVLIFLNNKLEYSIPRRISSADFEEILSGLESDSEERSLLQSAYTKRNDDVYTLCACAACDQTQMNNQCDRIDRLLAVFQQHMTESQAERYLQSAQEDEIMSTLSSTNRIHPSQIILINRSFIRFQDNTAPMFFNMNRGQINKLSQVKIHQLKEHVESIVPAANVIRHSLKWKSQDADLEQMTEDREYLDRFTTDVETLALQVIREHVESEDKLSCNNYTGINHRLYQELLHQSRLCQRFSSSNEANPSVIAKLGIYLRDNSQYPTVVYGPPGSGKSSVISTMAAECSRLLPEAASLVRFCGMTPFSCSMFSVFHSLIQQIDYLNESIFNHFKEEMPQRSFPRCSERACFQTLIELATDLQPLVILLDHVTADTGSWFVTQLPPHVKLIITIHEKHTVERLKKELCEENSFIELPEYNGENTDFITSILNPVVLEHTENENLSVKVSDDRDNKNELIKTSSIQDENLSSTSSDMKTTETLFDLLEKQFGRELVSHSLRLLVIAKLGLTSSDIVDIIADERSSAELLSVKRLIRTTWHGIKCCLLPFLNSCHHDGSMLHLWTSHSLKSLAQERYVSSAEDAKSIHKQICDYLVKRWDESSENNPSNSVISSSGNSLIHEIPYHSILSGKKDKRLLDAILFNPAWLVASIDATSTVDVIQVIKFVQTERDGDDSLDLETMLQVIWLCHQALDIDGRQIYAQIIIRLRSVMQEAKRLPKIAKLFNACRSSKVAYMIPSKVCLARDIKEADRRAQCEGEAPCNMYLIGSNSHLIASLFEEKGEIVIWDLNSGDKMKTLSGVNHPRALSMIDENRAVVLCDRELKVYDLDQEQVIRSLRGVLNLKMPLFSVPNQENVVALSRNRMYVNVMDIATGEMVATFKAGEDRFLDSLLVSRNGNVLVCGDATQKPSPLLVWDLKESRLVHDLRMAQHEFITSIADITSDGHYVVCACVELETDSPNFLVVYDLVSGQLFKVLKTTRNTTCLTTHVALSCVVSGLETGDFLVWDLVSGHKKFSIPGIGSCFNHMMLAVDSPVCISYYTGGNRHPEARTICLWDFQKGRLITSFTFDCTPTCAVLSRDGLKMIVGLPGYEDIVVLRLTPITHKHTESTQTAQSIDES